MCTYESHPMSCTQRCCLLLIFLGIVPDEYTLVSVHVAIRHGDRQNLHTIDNYKDIDIPCKMEGDIMHEFPEMKEYKAFMMRETKLSKRAPDKPFSNWKLLPDQDWCSPGDLTPTGATQHVKNGLLMRKRYINNFNLFNANEDLHSQVLLRSTLWSRTFQSGLALLFGFLQDYNVTKLNIETTDASLCHETSSDLSCDCPFTARQRDEMSATYHQIYPEVMNNIRTRSALKHYAEIFDISPKDVPKMSHLMDIGMVHVCHKHILPSNSKNDRKCTESWAVRDVHDIIQDNGRKQAKTVEFQKIAKLKYLPLLKEITKRLEEQSRGSNNLKFVLYSGHDSTINPLAIALNFSEGLWPSYASRIVIELYKLKKGQQASNTDEVFVKFLFNGMSVGKEMDFCKRYIVPNSDLCPLNVFIQYVDNILEEMFETSYTSACKIPM